VILGSHREIIENFRFSPDGTTLASVSDDRTVKLWDLAGRAERFALTGHSSNVLNVAFSPDGRWMATTSADFSVRLWDPQRGLPLMVFSPGLGTLSGLAVAPDGQHVAIGSDAGKVVLYEIAGLEIRRRLVGHTYAVNGSLFHPTRPLLATCSADGWARLWNLTTGGVIGRWRNRGAMSWQGLAFSPDGDTLAIGPAFIPETDGPDASQLMLVAIDGKSAPRSIRGHAGTVNNIDFNQSDVGWPQAMPAGSCCSTTWPTAVPPCDATGPRPRSRS